jgi:hypothetical protein
MKVVTLIARFLLVLTFGVFGLNGFLHFIKAAPPSSDLARQFVGVIFASHYFVLIFSVQVIGGLLFLSRRTVPLGLVMIAPVLVNILTFHILMDPAGIIPGAVMTVCWFVVFWHYRRAFDGILSFKDR